MSALNKLFEAFAMVVLVLGTIIMLLSIVGFFLASMWAFFIEQHYISGVIRLVLSIGLGTILVYVVEN